MGFVSAERASLLRCAYCHDETGPFGKCQACGSVYHADCGLAGCPTLGCRESAKGRSRREEQERRAEQERQRQRAEDERIREWGREQERRLREPPPWTDPVEGTPTRFAEQARPVENMDRHREQF